MKIFLICPVRKVPPDAHGKIQAYVTALEDQGHDVHWPERDTDQVDPIGIRICDQNREGIERADVIAVWYHAASSGSLFDSGMYYRLRDKPLILANPEDVEPTGHKSFENVLLYLSGHITYTEDGTGWVRT